MTRRFAEEQLTQILQEQEAGGTVKEIARLRGTSEQSFYRWKAKYSSLEVSETRRLKALEAVNGKLKWLLVEAQGLSERRVRQLAELNLSTWQYRARREEWWGPRAPIEELAAERRRCNYRRIHALLRRAGWRVNHKPVRRIYVKERLQVRKHNRKCLAHAERQPMLLPEAANQRWSMDFQHDLPATGQDLAPSRSSTTSAESAPRSRSTPRCPVSGSCACSTGSPKPAACPWKSSSTTAWR